MVLCIVIKIIVIGRVTVIMIRVITVIGRNTVIGTVMIGRVTVIGRITVIRILLSSYKIVSYIIAGLVDLLRSLQKQGPTSIKSCKISALTDAASGSLLLTPYQ